MVRILLFSLFLVGCTQAQQNHMKITLKSRAETFCRCNNSEVQLFSMDESKWSVWCKNGTGTQNASHQFLLECE